MGSIAENTKPLHVVVKARTNVIGRRIVRIVSKIFFFSRVRPSLMGTWNKNVTVRNGYFQGDHSSEAHLIVHKKGHFRGHDFQDTIIEEQVVDNRRDSCALFEGGQFPRKK